jgi:hypothetical protein
LSCNPSNFLSLTVWVLIPQTFSATADF